MAEPPRGFRVPVVSSRPLTPSTHEIRIEKPKAFVFRPTQFTFLQLKTDEGMDARPMSLASSPTRPHLEYAVRLSDSPYKRAFAALQPGDEVRVFGPIGDFVLHETRPAVLLAGGVGITPLKGMAEYAADKALPIPVRLVFSNRSEDEILYRDELDSLAKQNPNFRVFYTLTRSSADGTNRAACATSSGVPRRLIGWASISCCCIGSEIHWWFFSVRIVSGARAFTRIPNGPTWVAKCCVRIWMPAFAAAYGTGDRGFGRRAAEDDIVRIVPAFRAFIPGRTLLIVRNVAARLPSTEARQPSSVMSSRGPGEVKL